MKVGIECCTLATEQTGELLVFFLIYYYTMPWFIAEYFTIFLVTTLFHDVETIINNNFMYDYDFQKKEREKKKNKNAPKKNANILWIFLSF